MLEKGTLMLENRGHSYLKCNLLHTTRDFPTSYPLPLQRRGEGRQGVGLLLGRPLPATRPLTKHFRPSAALTSIKFAVTTTACCASMRTSDALTSTCRYVSFWTFPRKSRAECSCRNALTSGALGQTNRPRSLRSPGRRRRHRAGISEQHES